VGPVAVGAAAAADCTVGLAAAPGPAPGPGPGPGPGAALPASMHFTRPRSTCPKSHIWVAADVRPAGAARHILQARHVIGCCVTQETRMIKCVALTWRTLGLVNIARHVIGCH